MIRMQTALMTLIAAFILTTPSIHNVFADDENLDFGASLEEALGHFRALEVNLDEGNTVLAMTHATHPIAELYDSIKPTLVATSPSLDSKVNSILLNLKDEASTRVDRATAQKAIEEAKDVIEEARQAVIGQSLSDDPAFKMMLIKTLLETSVAEYGEAVSDGAIHEMAEFQDGSAFVWRSQLILSDMRSDVDSGDYSALQSAYADLWDAYDARVDPSTVDELTDAILGQITASIMAEKQERLDFGASLEEALGHFRALEVNLDEGNTVLAMTHATHPIAELYDSIKPTLVATSPSLDSKVNSILLNLKDEASTRVDRATAQKAIGEAKDVIEEARQAVIGDLLSNDSDFKMKLIKTLLETSVAEYGEAVSDGTIHEMAEFQDGAAFVWRSQQIFGEVDSPVDAKISDEVNIFYGELNAAYDQRTDPSEVQSITNAIINKLDAIMGVRNAEMIDFGASLEEALGHFRALEVNLDEGNTVLAMTHATHPIAELYDSMKPTLVQADPDLDAEFNSILVNLKDDASTRVDRATAQDAIDEAKDVVETARLTVIGADLSADPKFKLDLIKTLLETSVAEYGEAVSDGTIHEMAEFQDGAAFVWRSQQILKSIGPGIDSAAASKMTDMFADLNAAYDARVDPSEVDEITTGILLEINDILGVATEEDRLLGHVDIIRTLLNDAKAEYRAGNTDLALSYATKAYLDNFEFLEVPLMDAGERVLMEDIEHAMREDLRDMIKSGESPDAIDAQIDDILLKMDTVAVIVPEFGPMAAIVLAIAVISVIALTARSKISLVMPKA